MRGFRDGLPERAAAVFASRSGGELAASPLPPDFAFPELGAVPPLDCKEVVLPSGLRLFMVQDNEAPLVTGALVFPGGSLSSPSQQERCAPCVIPVHGPVMQDVCFCVVTAAWSCFAGLCAWHSSTQRMTVLGPLQVGLASIATSLQANSGTRRMAAPELVAKLDDMAASIEGSVTSQASSLVFECLDQDVRDVLGMVSEIVRCGCADTRALTASLSRITSPRTASTLLVSRKLYVAHFPHAGTAEGRAAAQGAKATQGPPRSPQGAGDGLCAARER